MKSFITSSAAVVLIAVLLAGCDSVGADDQLRVVAYSGPDFTASDLDVAWDANIEGNSVTLRSVPGEESGASLTYVISLEDRPGNLPKLTDVWYGPYGGGVGQQLDHVTIQVREWNLEVEISGVLEADLPSGAKTYKRFWIDLSTESTN